MLLHRLVVAAFALSALLAGCSGGGVGAPSTDAPTAKPTAAPTATPVPTSPPTAGPVEIAVSASTNSSAYTILLQLDDSAAYTQSGGQPEMTTVPAADATQFFNDLNANAPISNVQTENGCVKPVSFGTTTILTYEGSPSGDISCPPEPPPVSPAQTLWTDAQAIEHDVNPSLASAKRRTTT
jgi:hypothetical protein